MDSRTPLVVLLACTLLLQGAFVPLVAGHQTSASPAEPPINEHKVSGVSLQVQENNTTTRHRNPNNVSQSGDLIQLRGWLAGGLEEELVNCVQAWLGQEFDVCKELDGEYPQWLSKYVDVTGDTDTGEDDDNNQLFERAGDNSEQFSTVAEEFWQTYAEYQTARANNNTERARQKSRELNRLATQANKTGTDLKRDFREISNETDADLTPALDDLDLVLENITTTAEQVERETFEQTQTTATIDSRSVSTSDPATVRGQLTTQNGTPIRNESVTLEIGNQRIETRTNASGGYSVEYRPITLPTDTEEITVRFVPANTSQYAPSATVISGAIEPSTPDVTIARTPSKAGYNDTVTVSGTVTVGTAGLEDVQVTITLADHRLATVATNATGEYTATVRVPADVPDGDQPLEASVGEEGTALTPANASTTLRILPTETNLTIERATTNNDTVAVVGTLRPDADKAPPVRNLVVRLRIDGEPITHVRTGPDGSFAATLDVPATMVPEPGDTVSLTIAAGFDGQGTNLEADRATTAVQLTTPVTQNNSENQPFRQWFEWALLTLFVALVLSGLWRTDRLSVSDRVRQAGTRFGGPIRRRWHTLATTIGASRVFGPVRALWRQVNTTVQPIGRRIATVLRPYLSTTITLLERTAQRLRTWITIGVATAHRILAPLRDAAQVAAAMLRARIRAGRARIHTLVDWLRAWRQRAMAVLTAVVPWRSSTTPDTPAETAEQSEESSPDEATVASEASTSSPDPPWDERAIDEVDGGNPDTAIRIAYNALRGSVSERVLPDRALTHWEFFNTYSNADISTTERESLREIVEAYERAAFAHTSVSRESAHRVVDAVRDFQATDSDSTDAVADD